MSAVKFKVRFAIMLCLLAAVLFFHFGRSIWVPVKNRLGGRKTEASVVADIIHSRPQVMSFLPPQTRKLNLIVLKNERQVELWADGKLIKPYPMTAFSGKSGPKLKEGDRQIPEGFYRPVFLNPNSSYHLSIKLDYPNDFDREKGKLEKREFLGDDIFIHGKSVSIGCIAVGDDGIEELFCAVSSVGVKNTEVLISPYDMRLGRRREMEVAQPSWVATLYDQIERALAPYKK